MLTAVPRREWGECGYSRESDRREQIVHNGLRTKISGCKLLEMVRPARLRSRVPCELRRASGLSVLKGVRCHCIAARRNGRRAPARLERATSWFVAENRRSQGRRRPLPRSLRAFGEPPEATRGHLEPRRIVSHLSVGIGDTTTANVRGAPERRSLSLCRPFFGRARIGSSLLGNPKRHRTFTWSETLTGPSSGSTRCGLLAAAGLGPRSSGNWNGSCWSTRNYYWGNGMNTSSSPIEIAEARAQQVSLTDDALVVELVDGRTITVPLTWYPRLAHGSHSERSNWRLIGEARAYTGPIWTKTSVSKAFSPDDVLEKRRRPSAGGLRAALRSKDGAGERSMKKKTDGLQNNVSSSRVALRLRDPRGCTIVSRAKAYTGLSASRGIERCACCHLQTSSPFSSSSSASAA